MRHARDADRLHISISFQFWAIIGLVDEHADNSVYTSFSD